MSTKIYDAYAMDNVSASQLDKLAKILKRMYIDYLKSNVLAEEWAVTMEDLSQELIYNKVAHVDSKEKIIYYGSYLQGKKDIIHGKRVKYSEAKKRITSGFPLMHEVIQATSNMRDYDIYSGMDTKRASIAIFPDRKDIKFMSFGVHFSKLLNCIAFDLELDNFDLSKYKKELKDFNIKDYHYQNQTDKPDFVSTSAWNQRKKTWDRLMPSGVPADNGTIINILDNSTLDSYINYQTFGGHIGECYDNAIKYIKVPNKRASRKAKEVLFDRFFNEYVENNNQTAEIVNFAYYADVHRAFEEELTKKDGFWKKELDKLTSELLKYTLDYYNVNVKNLFTVYGNSIGIQNILKDSLRKLYKYHIFIQ